MKKLYALLLAASFAAAESTPPAPVEGAKAQDGAATLAEAYRREFAFLASQKRQLEKLHADFLRQSEAQEKQLQAKIAALQQQVIALTQEVERQESALADAEKRLEAVQETASLWEATLAQARTTLADYGIQVADLEKLSPPEQFAYLLEGALKALELGSSFHRQPGAFFLPSGKEVTGELLWFGNIAAYGISQEASGILLPAGEGKLKLLPHPKGEEAAKALAAGQSQSVLPLFLFESLKQAVEPQAHKTWRQVLDDGGPIAWIIAGLGGLGLALSLIRTVILLYEGQGGKRLVQRVVDAVAAGDLALALSLTQGKGAYPPLLKASLCHLDQPEEEWEIAVSDALLQQAVRIDRFASLILVIASVAPLLGLLGTVTGMIETFDTITRFGTGDPKLLATGISVALITTEVGLIVAIPLLLLGNLLNGWAGSLKTELELAALMVREAKQENEALKSTQTPLVRYAQATV